MCRCGTAFLLMDTIKLDIDASTEIPAAVEVNPTDLPQVIANASSPRLEVTAPSQLLATPEQRLQGGI
jgi:hypothetical protein